MWECLFPTEFPYSDALDRLKWMSLVGDAIVSVGLRPTIDLKRAETRECPLGFLDLMQRSWSADPWMRPSFVEISLALRRMLHHAPPLEGESSTHSPLELSCLCSIPITSSTSSLCKNVALLNENAVVNSVGGTIFVFNLITGKSSSLYLDSSNLERRRVSSIAKSSVAVMDGIWVSEGSDFVQYLSSLESVKEPMRFEGSLDSIWDVVFVNGSAIAIGFLKGKLALGEWEIESKEDELNKRCVTMARLAVFPQSVLECDLVGCLVASLTSQIWLYTKREILVIDALQLTTIAFLENFTQESLLNLLDVTSTKEIWGLTRANLFGWKQDGSLMFKQELPIDAGAGVFIRKFNAVCFVDVEKTVYVLDDHWIESSEKDVACWKYHCVISLVLSTHVSSGKGSSLHDLIEDVDGCASEIEEFAQSCGHLHFIDFLRFMAQLRHHWDPLLARRVLSDFVSLEGEKSVLGVTKYAHNVRHDFSRDELSAIEEDVKKWVSLNILERFAVSRRKTEINSDEMIQMIFDDERDLILIADTRFHILHLAPSIEHQEVTAMSAARAQSCMEAEIENLNRNAKQALQKRITVMMNLPEQAEFDRESKPADGSAKVLSTSGTRDRARAFVRPRK